MSVHKSAWFLASGLIFEYILTCLNFLTQRNEYCFLPFIYILDGKYINFPWSLSSCHPSSAKWAVSSQYKYKSCIPFKEHLNISFTVFPPSDVCKWSQVPRQREILLLNRVQIVWKSLLPLETRVRQIFVALKKEEPELFCLAALLRTMAWAGYYMIQKEIRFWCGNRCLSDGLCHSVPRIVMNVPQEPWNSLFQSDVCYVPWDYLSAIECKT